MLQLNKQWLKQGFQEKELSMNEVTLTVSIKYQTAEQTIRRIPSHVCYITPTPTDVYLTYIRYTYTFDL